MQVTNAAGIQDQFLTLLTAQLRHQDPLAPTEQEDFIAQLAQFSTLEGIEKLNANFAEFMKIQTDLQNDKTHLFQQMASAAGLVGTDVTFSQLHPDSGIPLTKTRSVEAVVLQHDAVHLRMEGETELVRLEHLKGIGPR